MKKIAIILLVSIMLVSCSGKNNEDNNAIKELKEQKDSLEKKNNELQEKNDSLEKENKELKEKIKKSENKTLNSESITKINKYLQEFNDSNKHFAKATFDEKNNTVIRDLWEREVTGTALTISKNLNDDIVVKILQPTDKSKTIVEVKGGKVIKDVMK